MMKMGSCRNYANGFTSLLLVAFILSMACSVWGNKARGTIIRSEEEIKWLFEEWQVKHDKSYQDLGEKQKRLEIFRNNLRYIDEHNRPENNHSFTVGLNNLADLSNEEYRSIYINPNLINMSRSFQSSASDLDLPIMKGTQQPASIDWRDLGAVGPVKNQEGCACCWAFTDIATIEGLNAILTGNLITLSEQELVDCDDMNTHCMPGYRKRAYKYIVRNNGIDTDANYPYQARRGTCKPDRVVTIDGYASPPSEDERALSMAVAKQPVGASVDASGVDFQLYKGGMFTSACTTTVNHAVTIVGYDSEAGQDYWIIKNSYGRDWGDKGYLKLPRNVADRSGKCGIALRPAYPTKTSQPKAA